MSSHIWNITRPLPETCLYGLDCIKRAMSGGLGFEDACRFSGYVVELKRQKTYRVSIDRVWRGALRSGHRYAVGINRDNYRKAGERMLALACHEVGLEDAPAQAVWDKLLEEMT